jgi:hypothetical protein
VTIAAGLSLMYLFQHSRLKRGLTESPGLKLFSLERLARMNWWSIATAAPLLTLGMATGVLLTWQSQKTAAPVSLWQWPFLVSGIGWLILVLLFGWLLASRHATGRLVAWRTLLAGGFVLATLVTLSIASGGLHGGMGRTAETGKSVQTGGDRSTPTNDRISMATPQVP